MNRKLVVSNWWNAVGSTMTVVSELVHEHRKLNRFGDRAIGCFQTGLMAGDFWFKKFKNEWFLVRSGFHEIPNRLVWVQCSSNGNTSKERRRRHLNRARQMSVIQQSPLRRPVRWSNKSKICWTIAHLKPFPQTTCKAHHLRSCNYRHSNWFSTNAPFESPTKSICIRVHDSICRHRRSQQRFRNRICRWTHRYPINIKVKSNDFPSPITFTESQFGLPRRFDKHLECQTRN